MRTIARLDVKNEFVIKGIHLEGLRKVGDPNQLALKYYQDGADELIFIDSVASLYERNNIYSVIRKAAEDVFIPITIGGGLRNLADVESALDAGADKVAINTGAVRHPKLIAGIASKYGSQCVVASVQAKLLAPGKWEAYTECGREKTGLDVISWAKQLEDLGAGELVITSIDKEGTKSGFDLPLAEKVCEAVNIPVVVSGGFGAKEHLADLLNVCSPSGVAYASVLHYNQLALAQLKEFSEGCKA